MGDTMKNLKLLILIFFIAVIDAPYTWAQTACPIGTAAGSASCGPSPGSGGGSVEENPPPRAVPNGEWESRWGSISVDGSTGSVGTSNNLGSKSEAVSRAKRDCESDGSKDCKTVAAYSNQCISLAWPSVENKKFSTGLNDDENIAIERSVSNCNKFGGVCRSVYSACSSPIFHKY
ncbi:MULTISPECIES: DUF4189 domain-containing protein [Xanthomonas]|uniref:DUF4189 domain-containing protein n=2 Tax=Xanthomonas TaxID=338 RepID=UPI0002266ACE|nr:hypothetical protein XACM_2585 [Xanthomonas euvesicatoria pv. citrumelo F1]PPU86545.1 DUF4189 domain-containing protein [Xanthomonas euvesicatoria pv. citrumelonis]